MRNDGESASAIVIGALPDGVDGLSLPVDPDGHARHLYAALRQIDAEGADRILIECPPERTEWNAVHDCLHRATGGGGDDAPRTRRG